MLCECYNEVNVIFSDSKNLLIKNIPSKEDLTLIYVDLVPDNIGTVDTFLQVINYIVLSKVSNVIVLPYPCIEWHMLKAFGYKSNDLDIAIARGEYKNSFTYLNNMSKKPNKVSFERFCKALLSMSVDSKYVGSINIEDFNISESDCFKLLHTLPAFIKPDKSVEYKYTTADIVDTINIQICVFIEQYKLYSARDNFNHIDLDYFEECVKRYLDYIKLQIKNELRKEESH